jgi:hypothetical protein
VCVNGKFFFNFRVINAALQSQSHCDHTASASPITLHYPHSHRKVSDNSQKGTRVSAQLHAWSYLLTGRLRFSPFVLRLSDRSHTHVTCQRPSHVMPNQTAVHVHSTCSHDALTHHYYWCENVKRDGTVRCPGVVVGRKQGMARSVIKR